MTIVDKDIESLVSKPDIFRPLNGSTVFVTGATGLIGSMLIKVLIAVRKTCLFDIRIIGQIRSVDKAKQVFGDLYDEIEFTMKPYVECNYIIHTVSPTTSKFFIEHPVETINASVLSTMEILEVAKKNCASMVYLSSMEQYGVPYEVGETMTEDKVGIINHLNVRSSYSESKRVCECLCASYSSEYGVNVKIARLAQTFGAGVPLTDNRMPMQFARSVVDNHDIILHTEGKSVSNVVYLSDAICGIITILTRGKSGEAYNVCNDGETRSVREIAELVCNEVACGRINVQIDKKDNMGYAPDVVMYLDSSKLKKLGWVPEVSMKEGYRRLVEYLRGAENE